jgi:hypothetical protein
MTNGHATGWSHLLLLPVMAEQLRRGGASDSMATRLAEREWASGERR